MRQYDEASIKAWEVKGSIVAIIEPRTEPHDSETQESGVAIGRARGCVFFRLLGTFGILFCFLYDPCVCFVGSKVSLLYDFCHTF